jgi:superfamily I DNA/RNA helicase
MTQETVNLIKDWEVLFHLAGSEELFCLKQLGEEYPDLKAFLSFLPFATEADISRHSEHADGLEMVTLSTLHAAKGLEFPVVFMVGVEEGLLPLGIDPALEAIAEEQRLFYVGVTRTQQRLYLANSQAKISQGTLNPLTVSRFLTMLPTALFTKQIWHQKASQLELF